MMLIGHYDERGYDIIDVDSEEILYTAGNHALESTQDATGTPFQLPIATIAKYCRSTISEMAEEMSTKHYGCVFWPERTENQGD